MRPNLVIGLRARAEAGEGWVQGLMVPCSRLGPKLQGSQRQGTARVCRITVQAVDMHKGVGTRGKGAGF